MSHAEICRSYSFETLECIVASLNRSRAWPDRLEAAAKELSRRKAELLS